jgi:hypothetical protein
MRTEKSEYRVRPKNSFQARFKGKMSLIDKEGHIGIAMKKSLPVEKKPPSAAHSAGTYDCTTADTVSSYNCSPALNQSCIDNHPTPPDYLPFRLLQHPNHRYFPNDPRSYRLQPRDDVSEAQKNRRPRVLLSSRMKQKLTKMAPNNSYQTPLPEPLEKQPSGNLKPTRPPWPGEDAQLFLNPSKEMIGNPGVLPRIVCDSAWERSPIAKSKRLPNSKVNQSCVHMPKDDRLKLRGAKSYRHPGRPKPDVKNLLDYSTIEDAPTEELAMPKYSEPVQRRKMWIREKNLLLQKATSSRLHGKQVDTSGQHHRYLPKLWTKS